jgi:hypothetical protein
VDQLETWLLRRGGVSVIDDADRGKERVDNVMHTGLRFICLDAYGALLAVRRDIQKEWLTKPTPRK